MYKRIRIRSYEVGLHFRDGEFKGLLSEGRHWLFDPLLKHRVDVVSKRDPWLVHDKLDMIVKSGAARRARHGRRLEGPRASTCLGRRTIPPYPLGWTLRILEWHA